MRRLKPLHFDVPEGTTQVHVQFDYTPLHPAGHQHRHQLSLMVFDPDGPRLGISRPGKEGAYINAVRPSPGGVPAPIKPGIWTVFVLVYRLLTPSEPVDYTLQITTTSDEISAEPVVWQPGAVRSRGPGWYRGDLHAHSIHSDGSMTIAELVRFWREREVDFMTLSDHDTISGLAEVRSLAADDLLTLGGMEISTFLGHAVAVGVEEWFDWRTADGRQIPVPEIAQAVIDGGALFTIAHPRDEGEPWCCGCRWLHEDMMPGNALAVEIWNGVWAERNEEALRLFYSWLNRGHRIVATSGTDLHRRSQMEGPGRTALNVVFAEDLTEKAIVAAVKAGRSYLSSGPELGFTATSASGVTAMVGDRLPLEPATVEVCYDAVEAGQLLRLIVDGMPYAETPVHDVSGQLRWPLSKPARWCTVELRHPDEGLFAVTNPIWFEGEA
ncbi:MAG: CehA/McbA family metallohydrolase [Trueperaceae bacterium]|nr:MAG: CehA/McbA family metallohydrolase [Trueperaceae bacterium]